MEAEIYFLRYYIDWEKKPDTDGVMQVNYFIKTATPWRGTTTFTIRGKDDDLFTISSSTTAGWTPK